MRILVTGSRDWTDRNRIYWELEEARNGRLHDEIVLVHGACPTGADEIAKHYAEAMDWGIDPHPAKWDEFGKRAGILRNIEMANSVVAYRGIEPVICLAFLMPCASERCMRVDAHDSHGTSQCADYAEAVGIPVRRYRA